MKNIDATLSLVQWVTEHYDSMVVVLIAAIPVVSLCVAGYAFHVVGKLAAGSKE